MAEIRWDWLERHTDDIARSSLEHLQIVGASIGIAVAVAVPIAIAVRRRPGAITLATGSATVLYTIPSLALFAILVALIGIGRLTAVVALAGYALGILIRNTLTGLREVPAAALDGARGMGMTRRQILARVELPLAVPAILTGVRVATIETVAIGTIAVFIGGGGLGELIYTDGIQRDLFLTPILAGAVVAVAMALVLDGALLGLQRAITPWRRRRAT